MTSRLNAALASLKVKPRGKVAKRALRQGMMDLNQTHRLRARVKQCHEREAAAVEQAGKLEEAREHTPEEFLAKLTPEQLAQLERDYAVPVPPPSPPIAE